MNDPDLIKKINVTDNTSHFADFSLMTEENRALDINDLGIFTRTGEEWK